LVADENNNPQTTARFPLTKTRQPFPKPPYSVQSVIADSYFGKVKINGKHFRT
jgi:hypothetical protein